MMGRRITVEWHWREWGVGFATYPPAVYLWIGPVTLRVARRFSA